MGVLKVHGNPFSKATMRVLSALHEKGLEFDFVPVDLSSGQHKKEPHLSLNPFGQVPAFEDGELKLFESRAITQYIAHEFPDKGNPLINPGAQMAIFSVWMEVEAHQFDPVASKLAWELGIKPALGMATNTAVVEENEKSLAKVLDVYEKRLSQSKYLGGEAFTLADLHHQPVILYLQGTRSIKLFDERPHVKAWVDDITSRSAWAKVVAMRN